MNSRELELLVEQITREVLARARGGGQVTLPLACFECHDGKCAVTCPDDVRRIIAAGAGRISLSPGLDGATIAPDIARVIDHTLLKPDATRQQIEALCAEARTHHFASVCINPFWVPVCVQRLHGSDVAVCTVVGFPLGATTTEVKAFETDQACRNGATEIDMVVNIGALKSGDYETVAADIGAIVVTAHRHGAIVKVIIEAALLTDAEKVEASTIVKSASADYVKTSTGFAKGGATVADVALLRRVVGPSLGVKAAGGVRTYQEALDMVAAGATRIGASAGVKIVEEAHSGRRDASPVASTKAY
ncbi:MAG: deoxyribose-phosphate aldolase [Ardenticatenaceae bacterium]|nr:deoxyribose-phosphate aldolase [Ardenticatenaceae bacterium]